MIKKFRARPFPKGIFEGVKVSVNSVHAGIKWTLKSACAWIDGKSDKISFDVNGDSGETA